MYLNKETIIKSYMEKLDIPYEEACQLYEDDNSNTLTEEQIDLEKKAKSFKRYEKSDKKRAKSTKERKIDPLKEAIINKIFWFLMENSIYNTEINDFCAENLSKFNESKINFDVCGESFTLMLTKHRKKGN